VGLNQADLEAPLGQLVERVAGETAIEEERHHRPCEMDWISEREIGDNDPSRGAEREAGFYGQAFLIEMVLRQHGGVG
jgi:hypothetical protein